MRVIMIILSALFIFSNSNVIATEQINSNENNIVKYVRVKSETLNIRSNPDINSKKIGRILEDEVYSFISEKNGWYKIRTAQGVGWIHGGYSEIVYSSVKVKSDTLNIRTNPNISSKKLGQIKKGDIYYPFAEKNGWYKIRTVQGVGWIHGGFVEIKYNQVEVKSETLNVRTSPNVSSKKLGQIKKGDVYYPLAEANGWYKIRIAQGVGWIHGGFAETKYNQVEVKSETLNVRVEPNLNSRKVTELIKGEKYIFTSERNGWYEIRTAQGVGWIHGGFVEIKYNQVEVKSETLNVRISPDINSEKLVQIKKGDTYYPLAETNGWYKIETEKGIGWIHGYYVNVSIASNEKQGNIIVQNINYSMEYEDMLFIQMRKNPQTDIYDRTWRTANIKDVHRYLNPENFLDNFNKHYAYNIETKIKIKPSILNVRKKPTTNSDIIHKVSKGNEYIVLEGQGGWYKINTGKYIGWVHGKYVSKSYSQKDINLQLLKITASVLNIRQLPDSNSKDIGNVYRGEVYKPIDKVNSWYKIKSEGIIGWIHESYTSKLYNSEKGEIQKLSSIKVVSKELNVRSYPSIKGNILTKVKKDENYIILSELNGWYKINSNGIIGWVSNDYTQPTNQAPHDMYQFLVLSGSSGLDVSQLNNILKGKGILEGKGAAFIEASRKYNINEIYLISHALLETGYGTSTLATGVNVNGKTVYNMYGIGAYDSNPIGGGSQYAYKSGWFTPEQAIIGGAKFISEKYVNNPNYKQDTLYKMKWNPDSPGDHQYATDIGWAYKQTNKIKELYDLSDDYSLKFEVPKYGVVN